MYCWYNMTLFLQEGTLTREATNNVENGCGKSISINSRIRRIGVGVELATVFYEIMRCSTVLLCYKTLAPRQHGN